MWVSFLPLSFSLSLFDNIKLRRFCRNCLLTENAIETTEILYLVCFPYFGLPSPPSSITCGHTVKTNATTLEWQTLLFNNIRSNGFYVKNLNLSYCECFSFRAEILKWKELITNIKFTEDYKIYSIMLHWISCRRFTWQ